MGRVHIRHGEDEIEVEGSDSFIRKHLDAFYNRVGKMQPLSAPATLKKDIQTHAPPERKPPGRTQTPAEFFKSKKRTGGVATILIFGKYLEQFRQKSEFSRADIRSLAEEAKIPKAIHSQYFTNAVKQGLLRSHGSGKYSLTLSAEDALAAMK